MRFNGEKLRKLRKRKKLSRPQLTKLIFKEYNREISESSIRNWETGKRSPPSRNAITLLIEFFEVSKNYFFKGE